MAENEYRSPVVESPVVGADEARPGYWAHFALQSPWDRGRRVRERPGTLLHALKSRPLCREPGLRTIKEADEFYYTIGTKTANIEALLAQSTGQKVRDDQICHACQRSEGPFLRDLLNLMPRCANCH